MRVVAADKGSVATSRIALRAAVFVIAPTLVILLVRMTWGQGLVSSLVQLAASFGCLVTMRRSNGHRGLHEFASVTRVVEAKPVLDRDSRAGERQGPKVNPASTLASNTITYYSILGEIGQTPRGRMLLARDERLRREVWLQEHRSPQEVGFDVSATLETPRRVRRIERIEHGGRVYDVYEALRGEPLLAFAGRSPGSDWSTARTFLADLVSELAGPNPPASLGMIWIDSAQRLRVLEIPVNDPEEKPLLPAEILQRVSRALLVVKTVAVHGSAGRCDERTVRRTVLNFGTID